MTSSADPAALPQCAVAVDLVVLTVREGQLCVLTVRRGIPPFRGRFALPGGFVLPDEGLEAAAYRELAEEAGLAREAVTLEQLRTFGEPQRDPRGRVVSVGYLALGAGLPDPLGGSDASSAQFEPVLSLIHISREPGHQPGAAEDAQRLARDQADDDADGDWVAEGGGEPVGRHLHPRREEREQRHGEAGGVGPHPVLELLGERVALRRVCLLYTSRCV